MKTSISIPDRIFRAAERAAKRQKISRSQLYTRALEQYLPRQSSKGIKEALDAIYGTESSELDPGMARMQTVAIGREEW